MINLLGSNTENFTNLLKLMNYKFENKNKDNETYFSYKPKRIKNKNIKKINKNNPFDILSSVNFK